MTVKQATDAGLSINFNKGSRSLFDILEIDPHDCMYDDDTHFRFAPMYKKWDGYAIPKRIKKIFWVGVKDGESECILVKRSMASCFSPRPVFEIDAKLLFDISSPSYASMPSNDLYEVPYNEYWALQDIS